MIIGLIQVRLSLPECHSLKEKRSVLRSLKDRSRNEMNISVAEVDDQDLWQSAVLAFVTVAAEKDVVEKRLSAVASFVRSNPRVVLLEVSTELL